MKNTSYERFSELSLSDNFEQRTTQYLRDKLGNLHDLSTNVKHKVDSVKKTIKHWDNVLVREPDNVKAIKFSDNYKHLLEQITLFLDKSKSVRGKRSSNN